MTDIAELETALLPDLSDDAPAGENLELDAEFGALDRAAQGRPETQYGDTINAATPPDWKEAEAIALSLLDRTRDLRVLVQLAIARLHRAGIPGFAGVLTQIRLQLENRWLQVHPQLDPEDDNDPTLRSNALYRLQDPATVLRPMRDVPLANAPKTGPVSWRDIAVFNGTVEPEPGREKRSQSFIVGAFRDSDPVRLQAVRDSVDTALRELAAITAAFDSQVQGAGPNLLDLSKLLADIQKELRRFEVVAAEQPDDTVGDAADAPEPDDAGPETEAAAPATRRAPRAAFNIRSIAAVTSRDDALYLLELVSGYFRSSEPSSPLPILIDRARRLASMEFMEILRDLAPDGLMQAQVLAGQPPEQRADE